MNVSSWKLVLECSALRRDAPVFLSCLLGVPALGRMSTSSLAEFMFLARFFDRITHGWYINRSEFDPIDIPTYRITYWRNDLVQHKQYRFYHKCNQTKLLAFASCKLADFFGDK